MSNDLILINGVKELKCKECGEFKELNDKNWYKHNQWFKWVLWRCKECIKKWRKTEKELIMSRKIDNNRYYNNNKRRNYLFKSANERRKRKWYWNIHLKTNRAINNLWIRPNICRVCNKKHKRILAHHEDYNKRYEIVFCCPICHSKIHKWELDIKSMMVDIEKLKRFSI